MLTLSQKELIELTGKTRKAKQIEALKFLGVPFKIRPDGTPAVLRAAMEAALGHATKNQGPTPPACVYQKHGAYWYVKGGKWRKIGTDLHSALTEYARIVSAPVDGLPALIDEAMPILTRAVANSTRKQYEYCAVQLKEAFADFYPSQVKHGDVVDMLDQYGDRQALANRMLTVLKLVFQWALDRGKVDANPCVSVKRYVQKPRDRLISPAEYTAIYRACPPWLQCVMDLCYLTGQRIGDVLKIEHSHLQEVGIYFEQQKPVSGWSWPGRKNCEL